MLSWRLSSGLFCLSRSSFAICRRLHNQPLTLKGLVVPWLLPPASPPSRLATPSHLCDKELSGPLCRHPFLFYCFIRSLPNINLPLLLVCPCVCVHFSLTPSTFTPFFGEGGHQPQSMGPWLLSPLPCPVPCLCSEAVCCGSTNARVRRKCMSCSPHVSSGPWLPRGQCGVVCLLGCTFWVELYAVCRS